MPRITTCKVNTRVTGGISALYERPKLYSFHLVYEVVKGVVVFEEFEMRDGGDTVLLHLHSKGVAYKDALVQNMGEIEP